ncbi:hypothetical protein F4677DRAFT_285607 [Hypoxylon crocopeplum]|nr:hypothetical protein F4677DRAFT_285607 [Hypoxylon crocopeplum]
MSLSNSLSQASLAAVMLTSTVGSYVALSPPNHTTKPTPSTGDTIRWLNLTVLLRLVSYASLGKNFTFALTEPDRLKTTGIYRYVQYPSYTGIITLVVCNVVLVVRMDGVLGGWIPPRWYHALQTLEWALFIPAGVSLMMFVAWARVREEERMLRTKFRVDWEKWHGKTARFIPWVI